MPYGRQAQEELVRIVQGKCLRVLVYGEDQYGRYIGDVYCNGAFVQVQFIFNITKLSASYHSGSSKPDMTDSMIPKTNRN